MMKNACLHSRLRHSMVIFILMLMTHVSAVMAQTTFTPGLSLIPDSINTALHSHATDPVEGVWSVNDGALFAIYSCGAALDGVPFDVTTLSSPDLRMPQGQKIGIVERTGINTYRMTIFTDMDSNGRLCGQHKYTLTIQTGNALTPDGIMSIERIRSGLHFTPWLYYRFFISMRASAEKKVKSITARKVYPQATVSPTYPIIL